MEELNGVCSGDDKGAPPPPSPLTGCYLLIVIGEPQSEQHKDIILQKIAKGLLSWNVTDCLVDLEKELNIITEQGLEGEEARFGERLIQFASENLVTEILIHPAVNTLQQCIRNLLSSFTKHRHIIHAGYTFQANGSWALQDGTFSYADFSEAFQENDVQRVIKAYENGITLDIHCSAEGEWPRLPKEPFARACKVRINPTDVLTTGSPSITDFINYLSPFLVSTSLESILESSDVVGNIRFSRPTLYVFPGGQGDAALFGINGFNMLLDGGYSRKACFWDFVRHLDRLDAVLLTRLNNSSIGGISSVLRRKTQEAVYPQIGHFFCNIQERKSILSPDGDKDRDPLLINLLEEGHNIISDLKHLNLTPQFCYRDTDPIILYHKVGHGTLNMYVLSPEKNSREVREFLQKWNYSDPKLFSTPRSGKEFMFPLQNLVSICALLVWQPSNPNDTITRILYPGSTPQKKIFEGLDRLKGLEYIKHPVCSERSIIPVKKSVKKEDFLDKIIPTKEKKVIENKHLENEGDKIPSENGVKKSDSLDNGGDKNLAKSKKSIEEQANNKILENGGDRVAKSRPKVDSKPTRTRGESQGRKKPATAGEKKGPPTPKKSLDNKVNGEKSEKQEKIERKPIRKPSPSATPAKSTKDANNRKVVEEKKQPAKKELTPKPAQKEEAKEPKAKVERKPISRRPKTAKAPGSPIKKVSNGVQKPDSFGKRGKLDKEGTTDSSTVSTPSADQESVLKKDLSKLTPEEIQKIKETELKELQEEQEAVKEIEAVFRKGEGKPGEVLKEDARKIQDVSVDDKLEAEEYLIIEKEEIEHIDEIQKLTKDSQETEKERKQSAEEKDITITQPEKEELGTEKEETQTSDLEKAEINADDKEEAQKLLDPISDEKIEMSPGEKKELLDDEPKEIVESHPEEKISANIESGATTTAPTLPEDEKMTLDEIKEHTNFPIEEKHQKEDTKEKDEDKQIPKISTPPKTQDQPPKLPPAVAGIKLDRTSHIRDIVKTPDEVADLPVHEEVDFTDFTPDEKKLNEKVEIGSEVKENKLEEEVLEKAELETKEKETEVLEKADLEKKEKNEEKEKTKETVDDEWVIISKEDQNKDLEEALKKDEIEIASAVSERPDEIDQIVTTNDTEKPVQGEKYEIDKKDIDDQETPDQKSVEKLKEKDSIVVKDIVIPSEGKTDLETKDSTKVLDLSHDLKEVMEKASTPTPTVEEVKEIHSKVIEEKITTIKDSNKEVKKLDDKIQELKKNQNSVEELKLDGEIPDLTKIGEPKKEIVKHLEERSKVDDQLQKLKEDEEKMKSKPKEDANLKDVYKIAEETIDEKSHRTERGDKPELKKGEESVSKAKEDFEELKHKVDDKLPKSKEEKDKADSKPKVDEREDKIVEDKLEEQNEKEELKLDSKPKSDLYVQNDREVDDNLEEVKEKEEKEADSKVKKDVEKRDDKPSELKDQTVDSKSQEIEEIHTLVSKSPETAEKVTLQDSSPEDDELKIIEQLKEIDKAELGRKSPQEREKDVEKIVAGVAEVLKSDVPIEVLAEKLPFGQSFTQELRETHITTQDSPIIESRIIENISTIPEVPEESAPVDDKEVETNLGTDVVRKKRDLIAESKELLSETSKIISDIQKSPLETQESEDLGTVHRMLVTASSEDGGEETEICPAGTIIFSKSSESSGRSSPDPSAKTSHKSSVVDTISDTLSTVKQVISEHELQESKKAIESQLPEEPALLDLSKDIDESDKASENSSPEPLDHKSTDFVGAINYTLEPESGLVTKKVDTVKSDASESVSGLITEKVDDVTTDSSKAVYNLKDENETILKDLDVKLDKISKDGNEALQSLETVGDLVKDKIDNVKEESFEVLEALKKKKDEVVRNHDPKTDNVEESAEVLKTESSIFKEKVDGVKKEVLDDLKEKKDDILKNLNKETETINEDSVKSVQTVESVGDLVKEKIDEVKKDLLDEIEEKRDDVLTNLDKASDTVIKDCVEIVQTVQTKGDYVMKEIEVVKKEASESLGKVKEDKDLVVKELESKVDKIVEDTKTEVQEVDKQVNEGTELMKDSVAEKIPKTEINLREELKSINQNIEEKVKDIAKEIEDNLKQTNEAVQVAADLKDNLSEKANQDNENFLSNTTSKITGDSDKEKSAEVKDILNSEEGSWQTLKKDSVQSDKVKQSFEDIPDKSDNKSLVDKPETDSYSGPTTDTSVIKDDTLPASKSHSPEVISPEKSPILSKKSSIDSSDKADMITIPADGIKEETETKQDEITEKVIKEADKLIEKSEEVLNSILPSSEKSTLDKSEISTDIKEISIKSELNEVIKDDTLPASKSHSPEVISPEKSPILSKKSSIDSSDKADMITIPADGINEETETKQDEITEKVIKEADKLIEKSEEVLNSILPSSEKRTLDKSEISTDIKEISIESELNEVKQKETSDYKEYVMDKEALSKNEKIIDKRVKHLEETLHDVSKLADEVKFEKCEKYDESFIVHKDVLKKEEKQIEEKVLHMQKSLEHLEDLTRSVSFEKCEKSSDEANIIVAEKQTDMGQTPLQDAEKEKKSFDYKVDKTTLKKEEKQVDSEVVHIQDNLDHLKDMSSSVVFDKCDTTLKEYKDDLEVAKKKQAIIKQEVEYLEHLVDEVSDLQKKVSLDKVDEEFKVDKETIEKEEKLIEQQVDHVEKILAEVEKLDESISFDKCSISSTASTAKISDHDEESKIIEDSKEKTDSPKEMHISQEKIVKEISEIQDEFLDSIVHDNQPTVSLEKDKQKTVADIKEVQEEFLGSIEHDTLEGSDLQKDKQKLEKNIADIQEEFIGSIEHDLDETISLEKDKTKTKEEIKEFEEEFIESVTHDLRESISLEKDSQKFKEEVKSLQDGFIDSLEHDVQTKDDLNKQDKPNMNEKSEPVELKESKTQETLDKPEKCDMEKKLDENFEKLKDQKDMRQQDKSETTSTNLAPDNFLENNSSDRSISPESDRETSFEKELKMVDNKFLEERNKVGEGTKSESKYELEQGHEFSSDIKELKLDDTKTSKAFKEEKCDQPEKVSSPEKGSSLEAKRGDIKNIIDNLAKDVKMDFVEAEFIGLTSKSLDSVKSEEMSTEKVVNGDVAQSSVVKDIDYKLSEKASEESLKKTTDNLTAKDSDIKDIVETIASDVKMDFVEAEYQGITGKPLVTEKGDGESMEKAKLETLNVIEVSDAKKLSISDVEIEIIPELNIKETTKSFLEGEKSFEIMDELDSKVFKQSEVGVKQESTSTEKTCEINEREILSKTEEKSKTVADASKITKEETKQQEVKSDSGTTKTKEVEINESDAKLVDTKTELKPEESLPGSSSTLQVSTAGTDASGKSSPDMSGKSTAPVSPSLKDSSTETKMVSKVDSGLSEQTETDDDDLSTKSQVAQSDLEEIDPMSMSFYGALPDETDSFLELSTAGTYLYEITKAKYALTTSEGGECSSYEKDVMTASFIGELPPPKELDVMMSSFIGSLPESSQTQPKKDDVVDQWGKPLGLPAPSYHFEEYQSHYSTRNREYDVMSSSFIGELPSGTDDRSSPAINEQDLMNTSVYFDPSEDPIASWGKPLGLPSPAPPNNNSQGTPKKEKKLPSNVSTKNKLNDDKKRAESPSKLRNKKVNPVYVDLTYVPHHGNHYYSYVEFFRRVRARYYVFSGLEPSRQVYDALLEAKQTWEDKELEVTIIPTYDTDILGYWVAENEDILAKAKIDLSPSASRCTINLQDHETSCAAYRLEF